jgi:hypothetical protein
MNRILLSMMGVTIVFAIVLSIGRYTSLRPRRRRWYEGFADKSSDTEAVAEAEAGPNPLLSLMGNLKRMSGYLINPTTWTDRITIMNMTPTELARHYIKSQNNVE